jgi:hypothetical protein
MQATVDRVGAMLNSRELAIVFAKHRGKPVPDRTLRFWRNELCIRPTDGCLYNREALKTLIRLVYWLKSSTIDITRRWKEHVSGYGSPLLREALRRCIPFEIVAVQVFIHIKDARAEESRLKRWKNNRLALRILPPWGVVGRVAA